MLFSPEQQCTWRARNVVTLGIPPQVLASLGYSPSKDLRGVFAAWTSFVSFSAKGDFSCAASHLGAVTRTDPKNSSACRSSARWRVRLARVGRSAWMGPMRAILKRRHCLRQNLWQRCTVGVSGFPARHEDLPRLDRCRSKTPSGGWTYIFGTRLALEFLTISRLEALIRRRRAACRRPPAHLKVTREIP